MKEERQFSPDVGMEVEGGIGATAQPLSNVLAVGQGGGEGHNPNTHIYYQHLKTIKCLKNLSFSQKITANFLTIKTIA